MAVLVSRDAIPARATLGGMARTVQVRLTGPDAQPGTIAAGAADQAQEAAVRAPGRWCLRSQPMTFSLSPLTSGAPE